MSGSGSKYFQTTKKGEIHDLKEDLNQPKEDRKVEAVKKVIAAMTEGKDVSMLFTDVLNCMQTHNLELKKLVYLYVMNYAKSQPDLAILAVNTFVKDASDPNPLIRALAVRTMGCIRVDKITEYLCEPLQRCLKEDQDPYVRKTAAVCVAKLYDINPELTVSQGFLEMLKDLLADPNPMVVANAVAALSEINEFSQSDVFRVDPSNLSKLLTALNECTEWGQVFILDSLAKYRPRDSKEAETMTERVAPRLNHSNSAVVLSAVKVIIVLMEFISNQEAIRVLCRKLAPPLITLLSSGKEPEIQYVALRNINLIVQKRPEILSNEMKVFFCKYNDPIYVKLEKLEIMIMLSDDRNIDQVLPEFKEYATMVDVEFVRKAVRAIGRCAIKLEKVADRCIQVLLDLIQTKVNYVVQEAIIVIKDIFRKFPNKYEGIIATLCDNLQSLDEPEAKASMVWIIGEYADRINNATELLESFMEGFLDENSQVQLQLLTAAVKLFLKKPKVSQKLVKQVLDMATEESTNPDLRDRGFVYWRLLAKDPSTAKGVVLTEKPLIKDTSSALDTQLLNDLIPQISTLASVYHKPPETFVSKLRMKPKPFKLKELQELRARETEEDSYDRDTTSGRGEGKAAAARPPTTGNLLDLDDLLGPGPAAAPTKPAAAVPLAATATDLLADLVIPSVPSAAVPVVKPAASAVLIDDFFAPAASPAREVQKPQAVKPVLLTVEKGDGMEIRGGLLRADRGIYANLAISNQGQMPLSNFALQFNKNRFGLIPAAFPPLEPILPGQSREIKIPVDTNGPISTGAVSSVLEVAIRHSTMQIFYFKLSVPFTVLLVEDGMVEKSIPDEVEMNREIPLHNRDPDQLESLLRRHNIFLTAKRREETSVVLYLSAKTTNNETMLLEMTVDFSTGVCKAASRCSENELLPLFQQSLSDVV